MKIVALDFDGVVNTDSWRAEASRRNLPPHQHLLPALVQRVNTIVDQTKAVVVATTNWRIGYTKEALEGMLRRAGATFPLFSTTPVLFSSSPSVTIAMPTRGHEILACFEGLGEDVEAFAILDDLKPKEFDHFGRRNLIWIDPKLGLTDIGAQRAIRLLMSTDHGFRRIEAASILEP